MSKRFATNLHYGQRKMPRLDISVSDHHLPLSQSSSSSNKENDLDNWGDDNDDEMLLQASQACEQAISADTSMLPEYNVWEPPGSSTQYQPSPSTSKPFTFKKPTANPPSAISTHLRNKCNTISSPLPGMANTIKPETNGFGNLLDDLIINDKVVSGQDNVYNQLQKLKEENERLKADNGQLQEKCVTKEGEASILRTQLKSCQMAVDNARMEKTRAQENVKMQYTEKLAEVNNHVSDLQTQLECKNLEIISIKEKVKKLESGKRLTQVTVTNHDISSSYRNNNSLAAQFDSHQKRTSTTSNGVQTDDKAPFLKLNKVRRKETSKISDILPLIIEPTQQQHSLLDYNKNLQKHSDFSQNKCKVVSTTHRMPSTPALVEGRKEKVTVSSIIDDLVHLAESEDFTRSQDKLFHLFGIIHAVLEEVARELEETLRRLSTTFQREMDERYIDATAAFQPITVLQLYEGRELYKDEQAVAARRLLAALAALLGAGRAGEHFLRFEQTNSLLDTALRICELIDHCSGGIHYSGFLISLILVLERLIDLSPERYGEVTVRGVGALMSSRASPRAVWSLLGLVRRVVRIPSAVRTLCPQPGGNLKVDYDQGLQLYKKDSCHFQVLLKQTEVMLKCIERQRLEAAAAAAMEELTALYANRTASVQPGETRCECQVMLVQTLVFALRICAVMLENTSVNRDPNLDGVKNSKRAVLAAARRGVRALYGAALGDAEFASRLTHAEGHLADACDRLRHLETDELYENMLSELTSTFQAAADEVPPAAHPAAWVTSFDHFSIAD